MIANAEQAVEALRHARTGEILPTKNVARNTKLVFYDDELVGLKFHDTVIARFTSNGCVIDTRDRWGDPTDHGWFSVTTFERINEFTRARTFTSNGLRYISDGATGDGAMLYMHGTHVDEQGRVTDWPLEPAIAKRIDWLVNNLPKKITRHADKVIDAWTNWGEPLMCCREGGDPLHYLKHIEANEYAVPPQLDSIAQALRSSNVWGDRLLRELKKRLRANLRESTINAAVKVVAPEFPYPQLERRRT